MNEIANAVSGTTNSTLAFIAAHPVGVALVGIALIGGGIYLYRQRKDETTEENGSDTATAAA